VLTAETDQRLGGARFHSTLLLERQLRANVVMRDRLVFDTRFSAAARREVGCANIYLVLRGFVEVVGVVHAAPCAYVLAEAEFERTRPDALRLRSWGTPSVTIDLRVPATALRRSIGLAAGPLALPPALWAQLDGIATTALLEPRPDGWLEAATLDVTQALSDVGVISPELAASILREEPEHLRRLWTVLRPMYGRFATSASLKQVATGAGLSLAQAARDLTTLARTFGLSGGGFRDVMQVTRLRMATLLLSARDVTTSDVARHVGYGSIDAMGRAFRDVKLPAPSAVQAAVAYETVGGGGA